jgi:hypothetical protein
MKTLKQKQSSPLRYEILKANLLNVKGSPPDDDFRKLALGIEFLTA